MRWYLSAAAVKQFMEIAGLKPEADGPAFFRAEAALDQICEGAVLKKDEGHRAIYKVKAILSGRVERLELYVSRQRRVEGPLDQLVRVRHCGGSRTGSRDR